MIQLWVRSTTKETYHSDILMNFTHIITTELPAFSRTGPTCFGETGRGGALCDLILGLFLRLVLLFCFFLSAPGCGKRSTITVYPPNWHATCETVNVFCLYWHHMAVKRWGERNPPYALQHHSKYSHTLWWRDNLTGDDCWTIYDLLCGLAVCSPGSFHHFNIIERVPSILQPSPQTPPSSMIIIIIIIIISLQSACKFDLYLQMSCLAAPSGLWQFSDKSQSAAETYFCSPFITIILRFTI